MKKIFSIFFSSILILILIYGTFIIKAWKGYEATIFDKIQLWDSSFDIEDWKIVSKDEQATRVNYLNNSDRILTYNWGFEIKEEWDNSKVNLKKGFFLVSINSLDKKYIFNSEGFNIEVNQPSTFFIDNRNERTNIFSIDSVLKINFLNITDGENVNTAYLYPNQYVFFNPSKNFLIKNADLLRISQLISLWYFSENIIKSGKINETFKKIFLDKNQEDAKNQEKLFLYIYLDDLKKSKEIDNFLKKNFYSIAWEDIVVRYSFLVLNNEKKSIYLKNIILKELQELLQKQWDDLKNVSESIIQDLEKLKNLNQEHHREMLKIIDFFSWSINSTKRWNIDLMASFYRIINWEKEIFDKNEELEINADFYKYNFLWNESIYSEIKNFIETKAKSKMDEKELNYFIFFLNKLIISNLLVDETDFEWVINIFKNYSKVWIKYYSAEKEENQVLKNKIIETGIVNFDNIITRILIKLEKDFFKRNADWLLEQNKWKTLNKALMSQLSSDMTNVYNFYTEKQSSLNNSEVKSSYSKNWEKFGELREALVDYEKYLINYDSKVKDLTSKEKNNEEKTELSVENAKKYLSKFSYINYNDAKIEVMWEKFCEAPDKAIFRRIKKNPTCYEISDMEVWNTTKISFLLYPNQFHTISNISIWGDKNINRWSYRLDKEEETYKSMWNWETDWKLYFWNFFVNVVVWGNSSQSEVKIYENKNQNNESSIIRTLKNTTLLWKDWTLTKLIPILNVKYWDISITEANDWKEYEIKISNADMKVEKGDKTYLWKFSSNYRYKSWKINSFFNPEINVLDESGTDILYWNPIKISGFIELSKFNSVVQKMFANMEDIAKIVKLLLEKDNSGTKINMIYFNWIDEFDISSKNIKIITKWDEIEDIIISWKKILEKNEKLNKIEELLK